MNGSNVNTLFIAINTRLVTSFSSFPRQTLGLAILGAKFQITMKVELVVVVGELKRVHAETGRCRVAVDADHTQNPILDILSIGWTT